MPNKKTLVYFLITFVLGFFLGYSIESCSVSEKPIIKKVQSNDKKEPLIIPSKEYQGRIAIIIDDFGYNEKIAQEFIDLDIPLDISILPNLPYSEAIAKRAKEKGKEIMLHLPLEPYGYPDVNPGPGVILLSMKKEEILKKLGKNLQSIPYAVGVDNHEGSKATENEELMNIVLKYLNGKRLFFIDARTSNKSVAYAVAKKLRMPTAKNEVFLDNKRNISYIKERFRLLVKLAVAKGEVVGIGHPHQKMLQALKESIPSFEKEKIEVVFISELLKTKEGNQ